MDKKGVPVTVIAMAVGLLEKVVEQKIEKMREKNREEFENTISAPITNLPTLQAGVVDKPTEWLFKNGIKSF